MSQVHDIRISVRLRDSREASDVQHALSVIAEQFTPRQLQRIAKSIKNPIIKAAIIHKLGA